MDNKINYVTGNVLESIFENRKIIIPHICNDIGAWGKGFVLALSNKWILPEKEYRALSPSKRKLGNVQLIVVEKNIVIANIIGQSNIKPNEYNVPPVRYSAIYTALIKIFKFAETTNSEIHMPEIGCGLGGGKWSIMEQVILEARGNKNVNVYVYKLH